MPSILRSGNSSVDDSMSSLCRRNCGSTGNGSTDAGVVGSTDICVATVGAVGLVLCIVDAEGGVIDCSGVELLGAECLFSSEVSEAEGFVFHFVPLSELAHLGSFAFEVPTVLDGPGSSQSNVPGAVGTNGVSVLGSTVS